jgi:hypothetical protein
MLTHQRLNEVIDTDIYVANEKSIGGYHCAQVFFGMTSKMLYVAGMKTESEFTDVYSCFIRKYGIPSSLQIDNANSEMIQRVKDINRNLIFADCVGDALIFEILKNDLVTVLHRSVVRSAADGSHQNKGVSCKSDVNK